MALKVNLVSKEAVKITRSNKIIGWLQMTTRLLVVILVAVVIGVFGWFFWTEMQVKNTDKRMDVLSAELSSRAETEVLYRHYQSVLDDASEIIGLRRDFRGVLSELGNILPGQVLIEGIKFDEGGVSLSGRVNGVDNFVKVIDSLELIDGGVFESAELDSVMRSSDGNYVFDVTLVLSSDENKNE